MPTTRARETRPTQEPETARCPQSRGRPERRSAVRSLLRLWPYVRPVRARLFVAAFVAVVASCLGLVIPLVLKWMVDGPVADRDPAGVWLGALCLLLLGLAEARAVRVAALAGGAAAGRGRGGDAGGSLPASAAAAGRLPRPLGLGAAALARHDRPDAAADVPGLPADVPAGQRGDDPGRLRHPAGPGLDARAGAARARSCRWWSLCSLFETRYAWSRAARRTRSAT